MVTDIESTDSQEALKRKGQRRINFIWEFTQAIIAFSVTSSIIYAELNGINSERLGNAFTLIMTLYFVRMNHIKVGGVGGTESR